MVSGAVIFRPGRSKLQPLLPLRDNSFVMIAVLVYFNGREAITSSFITPNTVVSILSTGCKGPLLSAASGCISQANWVLCADQPPRLFDVEMVADASRGPLGSIRLVFIKRFKGG